MFLKFLRKKKRKNSKVSTENKYDMKNWMDLTKQERVEIDSIEKEEKMRRKKALLRSIREDYIKIKNNIN